MPRHPKLLEQTEAMFIVFTRLSSAQATTCVVEEKISVLLPFFSHAGSLVMR
jgi:hypothetical protein